MRSTKARIAARWSPPGGALTAAAFAGAGSSADAPRPVHAMAIVVRTTSVGVRADVLRMRIESAVS